MYPSLAGRSLRRITICVLIFVGHAIVVPVERAEAARPAAISWYFVHHGDPDTYPQTDVYLVLGARRIAIAKHSGESVNTMTNAETADYGVPKSSIATCGGWWAGGGDYYYIVRHGRRLRVYHISVDESASKPFRELVKTVTP